MENKNSWTLTNKKNTKHLAYWTLAWTLTMALTNFGPKLIWDGNTLYSSLAICFNILIGIGMILANKRHLSGLDELQRKLHLEAMAVALGVAVVFGLGYSNLDIANVISYDAEISHLVGLIGITYLSGVIYGSYRYK
jgi:hypothetical protein